MIRDRDGNPLPRRIVNCITLFRKKQREGIIDVWWLYDDGGEFRLYGKIS